MSLVSAPPLPRAPGELRQRLEKLARRYDMETMKVFMVVEALGEDSVHAVYSASCRSKWQSFLSRQEACRLDLSRHDRTRERYQQFLNKVGREDQSRAWFHAMMCTLKERGAVDIFGYVSRNHSDCKHGHIYTSVTNHHEHRHQNHHHHHNHQHQQQQLNNAGTPRVSSLAVKDILEGSAFCLHLTHLFETKLGEWFDSFQAVAVQLTAHVKVSGLVRVLGGQVDALCTRHGRLHALVVKVTAQDTPRPLDVAELCLTKVLVIQNGLALPEDVGLALLMLHLHAARPVLRLWLVTPSPEMETSIRLADVDDMIDAGRLSQHHELWPANATTDYSDELTAVDDPHVA